MANPEDWRRAPTKGPDGRGGAVRYEGTPRSGAGGRRPAGGTAHGPDAAKGRQAPDRLTEMPKGSWWAVLKRTVREFQADELTDRAATLTYYGVLSLFPALLALVSVLGFVGASATQQVLDNIQQLAPGAARTVLSNAVQQLQGGVSTGTALAIVGLLGAVWSASGYVAAFTRAANAVYDVGEGRTARHLLPVRLGVTVALMAMACVSAVIVVFSGDLARQAGRALGVGDTGLTVWTYAKWPVLVLLVTTMISVLYWAAPNVKGRGFRWVTPGGFLALLIWMAASAGFAVYVANFASYNQTYGTLAGVIIFLVWLWITNLAILLGLEFNAELSRERAVIAGHPESRTPYVEPRKTPSSKDRDPPRDEPGRR